MNLIDAQIVSIDSSPYNKYGKWFVDVTIIAYGRKSKTQVMKHTEEGATQASVGDIVQI